LTPVEIGTYQIKATSSANNTQRTTSFSINPVFEFDSSKIPSNDGTVDISEIIDEITNQSWVYSTSLSENDLRDIVSSYNVFTIVGYDSVYGLLIQYDETDISVIEALEELKMEQGISSVDARIYEGENAPKILKTPADGSLFNDDGDNWHLEKIGMPDAWEYTTGNSDVLVGVSDSGYDTDHGELKGRVAELLTKKEHYHGQASAGAIGALTDNGSGMSGINWISQMVLGYLTKPEHRKIVEKKKVITVNASWTMVGYIPDSFDPTDQESASKRYKKAKKDSKDYKKLAEKHPEKLLVWAAGNGIDNGGGNKNGIYGTDGRYDSPALHYNNETDSLDKQSNVVFVAAMQDDSCLNFSSNYGPSVDIAAPTKYKSLDINGGYKEASSHFTYGKNNGGGFGGTSAAAPVVTGVASLIYSLYPGFTGKEVKDILVNNVTEFVTERYIGPGDAGTNDSNIEALAHPIPVLNAAKALEKAQEIIDSKVTVSDSIPNPFVPQARIVFKSIDDDFAITGLEWALESSSDGGKTWQFKNGMSVSGNLAEPMLDTTSAYYRITATVNLNNASTNAQTTAYKEHYFNCAKMNVKAQDTVTLSPLPDVTVILEQMNFGCFLDTGLTNTNGDVSIYIKSGSYKVIGNLANYQEGTTIFTAFLTATDMHFDTVYLNMTADSVGLVGSLNGLVTDTDGNPIAGASVRISGGAQTNGFFASATTNTKGYYNLSNISKTDSNGNTIESFILEASASGYATSVKEDVIVLSGKERNENFTLVKKATAEHIYFSDDFESESTSWSASGFWNRINLEENIIFNALVENGYTSLAPDEPSSKAFLPSAFSGKFGWWYGQKDTGSFIGTQTSSDNLLSGGTSTSANSGDLVSPVINLQSATSPVLRFRTWWEIESVNPNENGYDILEILISTDGGNSYTSLRKLNPYVDPNESDRSHKPFSSGGYNRAPVWAMEEIYLADYVGQNVNIRFNFKTNDELYNGFRGWILDDVEIIDFAQPKNDTTKVSLPVMHKKITNQSSEFIKIHKMPKTSYDAAHPPSRQ
jgi:hypothetical protein